LKIDGTIINHLRQGLQRQIGGLRYQPVLCFPETSRRSPLIYPLVEWHL